MKKGFLYLAMAIFASMNIVSCDDDDGNNGSLGSRTITIENVTTGKAYVQSGTFQMTGTSQPGILPGESVSINFYAGKGQALMFATMYGYSNDIFFAPQNPGIALYESDGTPITGDVSSLVQLWDNGTRVNQQPGSSVSHPGTAEDGKVTAIGNIDAQGNTYPLASELMKLTLTYNEPTSQFTLKIENISGGKANETPFSPGVWVVSNKAPEGLVASTPFFMAGEKSSEALSKLAEAGDNQELASWAMDDTGIITSLSPAIVVIYAGENNPLFKLGEKDAKLGLKELAQTGNVAKLKEALQKVGNVKEIITVGTGAITPGGKMEGSYTAYEGYNIAIATMFGYSNDWFYGNTATIPSQTEGNITAKISLLDSGTGVDQYPGAGNAQTVFGGIPVAEDKVISVIDNTYPVPEVAGIIKVTLK